MTSFIVQTFFINSSNKSVLNPITKSKKGLFMKIVVGFQLLNR